MTRLPRILLNAATAASLLLLVTTAGLWAWSRGGVGSLSTRRAHHTYSLEVHGGSVSLVSLWSRSTARTAWWLRVQGHYAAVAHPDLPFRWRHLGFGEQRLSFVMEAGDEEPSDILHTLTAPAWFVSAALAVPQVLMLRSALRKRGRVMNGHCPACGYDLRATPARCPECGALPPPPPP